MRKLDKEYLVALPVEPMPCGIAISGGTPLPLHCMVMPWFFDAVDMLAVIGESYLHSALRGAASDRSNEGKGIELVSEAAALFGPDHTVPVYTLCRNHLLEKMHNMILFELIRHMCWFRDSQYVGAGFRPHVTSYGEHTFPVGSVHVATELVLVERRHGSRERVVTHSFRLGR